jgi:hypothetical protein
MCSYPDWDLTIDSVVRLLGVGNWWVAGTSEQRSDKMAAKTGYWLVTVEGVLQQLRQHGRLAGQM